MIFFMPFFSAIAMRSDALWSGVALLHVSIFIALEAPDTLTQRFTKARQCFTDGLSPGAGQPGVSFSGFLQARLRHGTQVLEIAQTLLRQHVQHTAMAAGVWEVAGWVPVGCDGSRDKTPRSIANQKGLGFNGRHGHTDPQAWITTLLHLASGLTWDWVVDRGDAAERTHLRQMLCRLPLNCLVIGDAGFTGFDLWTAILEVKHNLLIRVGANVKLIRKLARAQGMDAWIVPGADIVWLWPDGKQKKARPIMLRLITLHNGKHPVYLVTSVLNPQKLSDTQAMTFYKMRWGVELWFRSLKQTMGLNKLRSQSPRQALLEFSFAAMAKAILDLFHVRALVAAGKSPLDNSCIGALKVIRQAMNDSPRRRTQTQPLMEKLANATKDKYKRKGPKASRGYPAKKKHKRPGKPKIRKATRAQQMMYQELIEIEQGRAFTA